MTVDQLKQWVKELSALLVSLDEILPGKVDKELIDFLGSIEIHPWNIEVLKAALEKRKK